MIGNDVVDLRDPDTDPARPRARFDARVCTPAERHAIGIADDPSRERWCHWAAKEAAYKLLRKREPTTIFSPVRFEVVLESAPACWTDARQTAFRRAGRVRHGPHHAVLSIEIVDGAVHALASWPGADDATLLVGVRRLPAEAAEPVTPAAHSAAVRRLALERIATRTGVDLERLSIAKRGRIPELRIGDAPCGADLSLSHHGSVVAFACRLSPGAGLERLAS